jgi:hypothetical protein
VKSEGIRVESSNWLGEARDLLAQAEYRFSSTSGGAVSAPNRAQGLRLRADSQGVQVSPRKRDGRSWDLGLALRGVGREGAMAAPGPAEIRADRERVEQRRDEIGLTEWYVNGAGGIEQGYTIDAQPVGGEQGSPLVLEIAYSGSLVARRDESVDGVRFVTQRGETALLYSGLMALDASGRPVESTLAIIPGALRISVRDQGHPYPIVVDPTLVVPSWSYLGDEFDERFGASVAGAGDVNGDGYADVIVGAPLYDNGEFDEGRAFVFLGSETGPSPVPAWTVESNFVGTWFGYSVTSAGDVNGDGYADVIVGAPLYDNGEIDEGRAFVFLGSVDGLSVTPAWTAEIDQNDARFGSSVASAGDVNGDGIGDVIVGAPQFDNVQNKDGGRAFVFFGSPAGLSSAPDWSDGSGLLSSAYGASVAAAGDVNHDGYGDIIVGAPLFDTGGFVDEGRVFVYFGSASGPSIDPSWVADGNKILARFGQSVASAGDVNGDGFADIIIGAPSYDSGRAFAYHGSATGPSLSPDFTAKINKAPADLGASVAGVGDVDGDGFGDVVVGAPRIGDSVNPAEGLVRVYKGGKTGLANTPAFTVTGTQANELLGGSVAGAGDTNGDGLADIIAGGIGLDNTALFMANSGGAELYLGFRTRQTTPRGGLHGLRFTD